MIRQSSTDLLLPQVLLIVLALLLTAGQLQAETTENYLIGRGTADVTGPAYGIPMWGFGRPDQLTQGIHIRQRVRAFVVAETGAETAAETPEGGEANKRLALVSVDIGSIEHNMVLEVVDRLKTRFGDTYHLDNLILSATHTHAGAGGYWHSRTELGLDGGFYPDHFDYIVAGIVEAIEQAHDDLKAGRILINTGIVEDAGVNRSLNAYRQNPAEERAQYDTDTDMQMTLLRFENDAGGIGLFNWFAVHPTSMTYDNHLISGDHKGYASLMAEEGARAQGNKEFVAAFAQSNPGDVTANLNLDNTGPGKDDIESTGIIGARQLDVALQLYEQASEPLSGPIDYRRVYVDLSGYDVSNEFTGHGAQTTCPSAYGYAFAAGSTEDGGGHFLFREGMTNQNFLLDFLIRFLTGSPNYTQAVQQCQMPKPILFETGSGEPPLQSQIRSVTLARIGQLVILGLPAEVTTMAGRRLRDTVRAELGDWASHVVLAGYVNGYAGYITTPEEYLLQQYEAGLAQALNENKDLPASTAYDDWRDKSPGSPLYDSNKDELPAGVKFGDSLPLRKNEYVAGDLIEASFWSGNPSARLGTVQNFLTVERQHQGQWRSVAIDRDWDTTIRWSPDSDSDALVARVGWMSASDSTPGEYRVRHVGQFTRSNGSVEAFEAVSGSFTLRAGSQ